VLGRVDEDDGGMEKSGGSARDSGIFGRIQNHFISLSASLLFNVYLVFSCDAHNEDVEDGRVLIIIKYLEPRIRGSRYVEFKRMR